MVDRETERACLDGSTRTPGAVDQLGVRQVYGSAAAAAAAAAVLLLERSRGRDRGRIKSRGCRGRGGSVRAETGREEPFKERIYSLGTCVERERRKEINTARSYAMEVRGLCRFAVSGPSERVSGPSERVSQ